MENKTQDYQSEILAIIRGNTSPGVMRNKLEDYHENDKETIVRCVGHRHECEFDGSGVCISSI